MQFKRLDLHKHTIPTLTNWLTKKEELDLSSETEDEIKELIYSLSSSTAFDCRTLPRQFVEDSGMAAMEEMRELNHGRPPKLPFDSCYFEFDGGMSVLTYGKSLRKGNIEDFLENPHTRESEIISERVVVLPCGTQFMASIQSPNDCFETFPEGSFTDGIVIDKTLDDPSFFQTINALSDEYETVICQSALLLCGMLSLINEKLIASEIVPDPSPRLSAARKKRGRPPVSSEIRILTLNIGAVRRRVIPLANTHESPCLHWRRGHWRIIHRGSEFETRAWVRKCLVGDPARGYVSNPIYKIVRHTPMLNPTGMTESGILA